MRPRFLVVVLAVAAAYVLGARAGRERYEQITDTVSSLWNDPSVKKAVAEAKAQAKKARAKAYKQYR